MIANLAAIEDILYKRGDIMGHIMPYLWVGVAVVLGIVELATTQLVSVWFVVASVVTAVASSTFLYDNITLQIVVFVLVSALCLAATRPLVKKIRNSEKIKTNADRFVGKKGKVISDIGYNTYKGQVEVNGVKWTAVTDDNTELETGTTIVVKDIQGVKLVVASCKE